MFAIMEGGRHYRVACLAHVRRKPASVGEGGHCIALLLDSTGTLRVYDPNGSEACTNPFRSEATTKGVEAFLSRQLTKRVTIAHMTADNVGVQARTVLKYGLCTVFAAYGLAEYLRDPTWHDAAYDVRRLARWCERFASVMSMNYQDVDKFSRVAVDMAAITRHVHATFIETVSVELPQTPSTSSMRVRHRSGTRVFQRHFKTSEGAIAWTRTMCERLDRL
jgi:hypothetical protein